MYRPEAENKSFAGADAAHVAATRQNLFDQYFQHAQNESRNLKFAEKKPTDDDLHDDEHIRELPMDPLKDLHFPPAPKPKPGDAPY